MNMFWYLDLHEKIFGNIEFTFKVAGGGFMHTLVAEISKQLEFVFKTQSNRQNNIRLIILSIFLAIDA